VALDELIVVLVGLESLEERASMSKLVKHGLSSSNQDEELPVPCLLYLNLSSLDILDSCSMSIQISHSVLILIKANLSFFVFFLEESVHENLTIIGA
jgi:hypothetical protein